MRGSSAPSVSLLITPNRLGGLICWKVGWIYISNDPGKGDSYIKIILEEYGSKEVKLKYLYQAKTKFQGEHDIIKTPRIY